MGIFDNLEEHLIKDEPAPRRPRKRKRSFTAFEDEWAKQLMDTEATRAVWALSVVLIRTGFFYDCFPVTSETMARARLTKQHKRSLLERLEALGLITVEWRGSKTPLVTPLHLTGYRLHRRHPKAEP